MPQRRRKPSLKQTDHGRAVPGRSTSAARRAASPDEIPDLASVATCIRVAAANVSQHAGHEKTAKERRAPRGLATELRETAKKLGVLADAIAERESAETWRRMRPVLDRANRLFNTRYNKSDLRKLIRPYMGRPHRIGSL